ncbi:hypothetical protein SERLADRAFT_450631 [Serpula lacrymans var. lacrymans S7.9]|uniref:Acyl-CoA oxidase n=1 Tax=Serpula lacrymans var. lacrymans (strain S7.9) TaxID=578457 RepID=F8P180_SERL9|nr:uncharacterized protein SERLADRAFT_450631 [Serpula lacrymans var. lacrymans S7.9]EGO22911.1 hypothetical protein SERLADRAFT_450631 [Serpula lacrymans var. lacrymans S7.9]
MAGILCDHPLFKMNVELLSWDQHLTASDVLHCSPKFWALQADPIMATDIACYTILAAHVGLTIGTIAKFAESRDDLKSLIEKLLRLDIVGVYLLSERGHGLDAFNIETTATLTEHHFILNTPREEAAKWMPATTPLYGVRKVAVVMARLIVSGSDRGVRPFIVPICDTRQMCSGITSTRLPPRTGSSPLDFSITSFNNVRLPHSALLGADLGLPEDPLKAWWDEMWRIPLGTAAVAAPLIQGVRHAAYIGGQYSLHRMIMGKGPAPVSILTFRTQQRPVLQAIACAMVLHNWFPRCIKDLMNDSLDHRVRHGLAVILKTSASRLSQLCIREVAERCGAQGTFEHNCLIRMEADGRGVIIAEGDVLVLCIRLFTELLLDRYTIPSPRHANTILWENVLQNFKECKRVLHDNIGDHRSDSFNRLLLPLAESSIAAIGHALAYSAAIDAGLPQPVIDMFESVVQRINHGPTLEQCAREDPVINRALPQIEEYLSQLDIEPYVSAPIVTDKHWKDYVGLLPTYYGNANREDVLEPLISARL